MFDSVIPNYSDVFW